MMIAQKAATMTTIISIVPNMWDPLPSKRWSSAPGIATLYAHSPEAASGKDSSARGMGTLVAKPTRIGT